MVTSVRRHPAALLVLWLVMTVWAAGNGFAAPAVDERDARLSVVIDDMQATPYENEMILVTVRGLYDVTIALEKLRQPDLRNFSWMQLGRDVWTSERIDGRQMTVFERRLALFPDGSGDLTIGPFIHHLTLVSNGGERFVHDVRSKPISVAVDPKPKTNGKWWLPARSVTYSDEWNMDPAMMANGATAVRTVTITAVGVPPADLPPPPKMLADWLITFIAPEKRTVELTWDGPISTVEWQWRMRPARSEPGELKAFHIPWFDTTKREMRDIVLKSQRIAFAAIAEPPAVGAVQGYVVTNAPILAAVGGFVLVLVPLLWRRRFLGRKELVRRLAAIGPDRDRLALRRAVRRNDAAAVRAAARRLTLEPRAPPVGRKGDKHAALADLDQRLFGRGASTTDYDLRAFAQRILARGD